MTEKLLSLLLAGSFFFFGAGRGEVAKDVVIDGVEVGGMPYEEAERVLRSRNPKPPLSVVTPQGEFPLTCSYTDDITRLVRRAKRGQTLKSACSRNCIQLEEELRAVCKENAKESVNAELVVTREGFLYRAGQNGIACNYSALLDSATRALSGETVQVYLETYEVAPQITEEELRRKTVLLSSFSTRFDEGNVARAHNVHLAGERLSGQVILPHAVFSFNRAVGERSRENGFLEAPVILSGRFINGVGGGVCQVSTTLFNAALTAGMTVVESHAHSLTVGYVAPSLDAMVSSACDLQFVNPYEEPVYLFSKVKSGKITFCFYGLPDGRRYVTESSILMRVPPPAPKVSCEEEERAEREGLASESYLSVYEGNTLIRRTRIRRDSYSAVQGIVHPPKLPEEAKQNAQEAEKMQNEG